MIPLELTAHVVGSVGALVLLLAYFMVSSKRMTGDSKLYQVLNIVGAAAIGLNSTYFGAWPSTVLNVVWIGIGLMTVRNIMGERKQQAEA